MTELYDALFEECKGTNYANIKDILDQGAKTEPTDAVYTLPVPSLLGVPPDRRFSSPLILACGHRGDCKVASLLLQGGAKVDWMTRHGSTAFTTSCMEGNTECVSLLLDHKADINQSADIESGLKIASWFHHLDTTVFLLRNGADPEGKEFQRYGHISDVGETLTEARVIVHNLKVIDEAENLKDLIPIDALTDIVFQYVVDYKRFTKEYKYDSDV